MGTKESRSHHGGSSQHEDGLETEDERGHRYHGERRLSMQGILMKGIVIMKLREVEEKRTCKK